jgi:membrane fusion protein
MNSNASSAELRLFRHEVLDAQRTDLPGGIVLAPRPSATLLVVCAAAIGLAVLALLVFGSYTRRSTVSGQLLPSAGVIRVRTPQAGVVLEKRVAEGQAVNKGDVLFVISSDRPGAGSGELQEDIGKQVAARRESLQAELARNRAAEATEAGLLQRRITALRGEAETLRRQLEQQAVRLKLAQEARARYQGLADQDYIAREQLDQKVAELSEQQSRQEALRRDLLGVERELDTLRQETAATHSRYANQNGLLQRSIASTQQESTEVEGRRRVFVVAPQSGRATLVAAEVGQAVDNSRPLVNVVPRDGALEARLYAPSATVGFVRPGDAVSLRYQSFPYQKFGQASGQVESVSNVTADPAELAGLPGPAGATGEPVYTITVRLQQQSVTAYGKQWPLQAGMRLDADVLHETRRLYEWMLEPLYSITGKM